MTMKTERISVDEELKILIESGSHRSKADLLRTAFRFYKEAHPEIKLEIAIRLYQADKVSLARAAELAGTDLESFKAILTSRKLRVKTALGSKAEIARGRKQL